MMSLPRVIRAGPTMLHATDMGAVFRIAGGVWIGIGLINAYLAYWDGALNDRVLMNSMVFYGLPGLLLLILGSVLKKKA